jgi:hypothetical protein
MPEPIPRLGDLIDDYCPRCRLLLNHHVASLVEGEVVKVVCQTCHSEHPYRHAEVPQKKKPSPRQKLFTEVLSKAEPVPPRQAPEVSADELPKPEPAAPRRKRAAAAARYISRHKTRPPKGRS